VVGRWLFRIFMLSVILGGAAWIVSLIFFGDPTPELEFEAKGEQVVNLEFSPDGTKLAVVTYELKPPDAAKLQATRIYQVSDGKPLHTLQQAAWRCNWNSDGSLLVVSAVNGKEFDIYDTAKWQLKKHLTLTPPRKKADAASKDKKEEDPFGESPSQMQAVPGIVQALAFTRQGSLFAVTFAEDADSSYQLNHAKAWWDPLHSSEAESLGSCGGAWDMGVVSTGIDAMLALSYSPPCPPDILNVSPRGNSLFVQGKVELKDLPHPLVAPRLRLTPDGNYLVARDEQHLDVMTLSSTGPQVVASITSPTKAVKGSMIYWKELELSRDGRFAAYASEPYLRVIRIPDGKQMLEIVHKPCSFALSPDGSQLAVADHDYRSVRLYRVH
jgi:WD40 repeat protein